MELREILALDVSFDSKVTISKYLDSKNKDSHEFSMGLAHLVFITYMLGDVSAAFKLAFEYLNICENRYKVAIYNSLIKIYYDQRDYDNVLSAIKQKREFLPKYNKVNFYEDMIVYYQTIDDKPNLIQTLIAYLQDDINDEKRLKAIYLLETTYLEEGMYEEYEGRSSSLKTLAISQSEDTIYKEALYNDSFVLYVKGNYQESLANIEELLTLSMPVTLKAKALTLKLKDLISLEEYNQASIFEAEIDQEVYAGDLETQIEFAESCISLYSLIGNNFNTNVYVKKKEELLVELESEKQTIEKRKNEKKKFSVSEDIISLIPETEEKKINEEVLEEIESNEEEKSEAMFGLSEIFKQMNSGSQISLREMIRVSLEGLNKICIFDEAYLIYDYLGITKLHYKKERLYDKRNDLTNTFVLDLYNNQKDEVIFDTSKTEYISEFSTRYLSDESIRSYIGFSFKNGAIVFAGYDPKMIQKKLNYENLSLYKEMLAVKINEDISSASKIQEKTDFNFLLDTVFDGSKRQIDNYVILDKKAQQVFNLPESVTFTEFLIKIDSKYHQLYRDSVNDLVNLKLSDIHLEYCLVDGTNIFEDMHMTSDMTIYSVFRIADDIISAREEGDKYRFIDPVSKCMNKTKLLLDLDSYKKEKFVSIMIEMIDYEYYKEIYGYDFSEDLLYAVSKVLKKYDKMKFDLYHYDYDRFVLISFEKFDQRNVYSRIGDILEYLSNSLHEINKRVNVEFKASFLKYPQDTNQLSGKEIILSNLYSLPDEGIKQFSKEDYKERMFESQLVTYISEELDSKRLEVEYEPVFSHLTYDTAFYNANINMLDYNVENKDVYAVLRRRGMVSSVERYVIDLAFKNLKEMKEKNVKMLPTFINVSYETFIDNFVDYLNEKIEEYQIDKNAFIINYSGRVDDKVVNISYSLISSGISLSTSNMEFVKKVEVKAIFLPLDSYSKEYLDMITYYSIKNHVTLIASKVNSEEDAARFAEFGINYYSGKLGKRHLTIDDLINNIK